MPVRRDDPYPGFNFLVELGGEPVAGFHEIELPEGSIDVIEQRDGNDPTSAARPLPGRVRYANVVLRRGLAGSTDLYEWWDAVRNGALERRDVVITLLDEARQPVARWLLRGAWPARLGYGRLDALASEVVVETLELAYDRFELD